jgi:hypothetical protein
MAEMKPLTFTALERKKIKAELNPRTLVYVEALEAVALEANMLLLAHEEVPKRRISLGRVLSVINFMA